jgi:hypothetical protein
MPIVDNHGEPERLRASVRQTWQKMKVDVKMRYVDLLPA